MGGIDKRGNVEILLRGEKTKLKLICDDCFVGDHGELVVERWIGPDERVVVARRMFAAGFWEFAGWDEEGPLP